MEIKSKKTSEGKVKRKYIKIIILCLGMIMIAFLMWCAPMMVDDYSFSSFSNYKMKDKLFYVLKYGNGRLLGNMGVLYLLQFPVLKIAIKTIVIILVIIMIDKNTQFAKSKEGVILSFLLIMGMEPQMFAQVFTWTSGFQNYIPPVLCMLLCMKIVLEGTENRKFLKAFLIGIVGICGQLFVEHSTVIILVFAILILNFNLKNRKNVLYASMWVGSTIVGTIIMYTIPKIFYVPNVNEGYQKLNLMGIKPFIISIVGNTLQISEKYSENFFLWCIISGLVICIIRKNTNKNRRLAGLSEIVLVSYPSYCVVNYLLTQNRWYDPRFGGIVYKIFLCCLLLAYLISVIYGISNIVIENIRLKAFVCLGGAVFSVLPLLIVYPIGSRCLFHSYTFMVMLTVLIFKYHVSTSGYQVEIFWKKIFITLSVILSICLIFVFLNIRYVDTQKHLYIQEELKKGSKEIIIPKLPYRYVHYNENNMIEEYYFNKEAGDVSFETVDYIEWLNEKEK